MLAHEIRQKYLQFFISRGHVQLPGAPLVPVDVLGNEDRSILFSGSGMEQFKPYFTGAATPPSPRVTTVQKCVRTVDIDAVGDFSHCTFFEMLGNFSFGDYFKADVIPWTWEFLTNVVGLDGDRLCVTVYIDDDEAYEVWKDVVGLPSDRIHRQGEDKNFWPASVISQGPDGPCGPCSEIFYRIGEPGEMTTTPGLSPAERYAVDDAAGRWLEIWNNVFTQFSRSLNEHGDPQLTPLPRRNNDTGAGLDRIAFVSQGKRSVFETDLFGPTLERIASLTGRSYTASMSPEDFAYRVIAEHTRSMVFCIADGILPSNEGRGYVLRYLMRRAIRYGKKVLGFENPFLTEIVPSIIEQMGSFYTELVDREALIMQTIRAEEEQFGRTLDRGLRILDTVLSSASVQHSKILGGQVAFDLYSTYGFPIKLTQDVAAERAIEVDIAGFEQAMNAQRHQSQQHSSIDKEVFSASVMQAAPGSELEPTKFVGYEESYTSTVVSAIYGDGGRITSGRPGDQVLVAFPITPFYAESGGQVGDTGWLTADGDGVSCALRAEVLDTRRTATGVFLHTVRVLEGELYEGQRVLAQIDGVRRRAITRNHTATHLLQAALRRVLGDHVHQKGSRVGPDRLRFDFTHNQAITSEQRAEIERLVNEWVLEDEDVSIYTDVPISEAKKRGAMALFGEKYGSTVRMVEVPGISLELCGGAHIHHTSSIGLFKIMSETGSSSGVRRIEAVTGEAAYQRVVEAESSIARTAALLKISGDLFPAVERLVQQRRDLEKQVKELQASTTGIESLPAPVYVDDIPVLTAVLKIAESGQLADRTDAAAQQLKSGVVVLGAELDGKVIFAARVTTDLIGRGLNAGRLVKEAARIAGGGGGGRADFATAGGRDASRLQEALASIPDRVAAELNEVSR